MKFTTLNPSFLNLLFIFLMDFEVLFNPWSKTTHSLVCFSMEVLVSDPNDLK